jgi:hypothetical protein
VVFGDIYGLSLEVAEVDLLAIWIEDDPPRLVPLHDVAVGGVLPGLGFAPLDFARPGLGVAGRFVAGWLARLELLLV